MKKDLVLDIFLSFSLMALLFLFFFPAYFVYGQVVFRSVGVAERIFSVIFVLLWFALCALTAYTKKISMLLGGLLFSVMAYIPEWVLSKLVTDSPKQGSLLISLIKSLFLRLYEWINAPMVGISMLFDPKNGPKLSKWMLPILLGVFVFVQLFRFYRDAYLAEQLRLDPMPSTTAYEVTRMSMDNGSSRNSKSAGIRTYAESDSVNKPDDSEPAPAEPARATESLEASMDETLSKPDFPDVSATGDDFPNAIERSDEDRYN
ncbi:MAG: hypothetical protein GXY06_07895 [Clostridiaceae bacterium]|nr:hypothetical protein [Clostridiaceae bacterium]